MRSFLAVGQGTDATLQKLVTAGLVSIFAPVGPYSNVSRLSAIFNPSFASFIIESPMLTTEETWITPETATRRAEMTS